MHLEEIFWWQLLLWLSGTFLFNSLLAFTICKSKLEKSHFYFSITFGIYLVLTFSIFVGISKEPILFATYILYTIIPSVRLYVLSEGAEMTKRKMFLILDHLRQIEASCEADMWTKYEFKQFALTRMKFQKPKGYDAAGFFFLNRKFMAGVFGALMTYLVVLLQFKLSDSQLEFVKKYHADDI